MDLIKGLVLNTDKIVEQFLDNPLNTSYPDAMK